MEPWISRWLESTQPSIIKDIGRAITWLRDGKGLTLVLVEQYLDLARGLADTVAIMDRCEIIFSGDVAGQDDPMYADTSRSDGLAVPLPNLQRASGRARISFRLRDGATALHRLYQEGSAKLRLPKSHGGVPETVLINTAGGLTGGDSFVTEIVLGEGTQAVATTQACERIYRSTGADAKVSARIELGEGARFHWLPQETILFDRARLSRRLEADLAAGAEMLAVESVLFGRKAMDETVRFGFFHDRWRIRCAGQLVMAEDFRLDGPVADLLAKPAILAGNAAMATLVLLSSEPERHLDAVRAQLGDTGGASAWDGRLVARLLALDGLSLRRKLIPVLRLLSGAPLPKVWQL